ncbi:NAD(P)H-binding protein [Salinibacterium hongtaonis]|uniref:NAD(P)H-binding protein n=1 Tax=Homoserinimonas hongtaonis TaxID=2079791 RepID=UPI0030CE4C0C
MVIAVTGASGQLGHLIIDKLIERGAAPADIVGIARTVEKAADLAARGIEIRQADYSDAATLPAALAGVDRLVLVSGSEIGQRAAQHHNIIEAAKAAGVGFIAYTSLLNADKSTLGLAEEHRATEAELATAGIPFAVLRNGWYTENYTAGLEPALASGALYGAAGEGRIATATRADYAEAAAAIALSAEAESGSILELGGDEPHTLAELARVVSEVSGTAVAYENLTPRACATHKWPPGCPRAGRSSPRPPIVASPGETSTPTRAHSRPSSAARRRPSLTPSARHSASSTRAPRSPRPHKGWGLLACAGLARPKNS